MSQYRGVDLPEVVHEGLGYHIVDTVNNLLLQEWSESQVLRRWRDLIDAKIVAKLLEDERIVRIGEEGFGCTGCGSLIYDPYLHTTACSI